jgi:hypothetical protein
VLSPGDEAAVEIAGSSEEGGTEERIMHSN